MFYQDRGWDYNAFSRWLDPLTCRHTNASSHEGIGLYVHTLRHTTWPLKAAADYLSQQAMVVLVYDFQSNFYHSVSIHMALSDIPN